MTTKIRKGEVALRLVDLVTGENLGSFAVAVVPRVGEFVKVGGKTRRVFDVEHDLDLFRGLGDNDHHTIHRVTARLTTGPAKE